MHRLSTGAALLAASAAWAPAVHAATPVFTPIVQVYCAFEGDCVPQVPVTQMIETQPGVFLYVGEYGMLTSLNSAGGYSEFYLINDTNTFNGAPFQASDGNVYVPTSLGSGAGTLLAEFDSKLQFKQNIATSAFPYGISLVETPGLQLWGASAPGYFSNAWYSLPLGGPATDPTTQNPGVNSFLVGSDGALYGQNGSALFKFASDGSYTTVAALPGAVPGLIQASDGNFYVCNGTLVRVTPQGVVTTIPGVPTDYGCVIQASDGKFYGANQGGVYSATLDGQVATVYAFNGFDHGQQTSQYVKSIIQGSDGKLYGQTTGNLFSYGINYNATIWSLDIGLPKPQPAITRVTPVLPSGRFLAMVTGHYFLGTSAVTVNGHAVRYKVRAAEYLEIVLPKRTKAGTVTITTPNGTASGSFALGQV